MHHMEIIVTELDNLVGLVSLVIGWRTTSA